MVLVRTESVRSLLRVFKPRLFVVARCCIATFSRHAIGFPDHLPSCWSGRAQKEFVAGCGFDTSECVSVCEVCHVLCQHHVTSPQSVFVFLCVVSMTFHGHRFDHCCAAVRSKIPTVCLLTIVFVLAPILVATLVSRRRSLLRVWSQRQDTML